MRRAEPVIASRALVLDAHSSAGLECVQSLGRAGVCVHAASELTDCLAFRSRFACACYLHPDAQDVAAFTEWLRALDRENGYSLIIPATENTLCALNSLAGEDLLRRKAMLPSATALEVALSKEATTERAARLGIRVPASRLIESVNSIPDAADFPVVLKPTRSLVHVGGRTERLAPLIVRDEAGRRTALVRMLHKSSVQEQQYISGRGVGVECLYEHGRLVWVFVHERIHELPLTGGGSSYRKSVAPDPVAIQLAKRLLDDLDWHGVAMVEFKRQSDGSLWLMEINPRFWGSLALAIDAGVDFPLGLWRLACGDTAGPQPLYRVPYYTRQIVRDIDWLKENWRADHGDPLLLTRPRARSLAEYLRPLLLQESWDHFSFRDPVITWRQLRSVARDNIVVPLRRHVRNRIQRRKLRGKLAHLKRQISSGERLIRRVMFVCYGNICRSPFAEVYANEYIREWHATSAALHGAAGRESPEHLVRTARAVGVNLEGWQSRQADEYSIAEADLICTMDTANYEAMLERFPHAADRTLPLGLFDPKGQVEIEDPYSLSEEATLAILVQIRRSLEGLASVIRAASAPRR